MKLELIKKSFVKDGETVNYTAIVCPVVVNGLSHNVVVQTKKDDYTAKSIIKNNIDTADLELRIVTKNNVTYQNPVVVIGAVSVPVVISDDGLFIINLAKRK